MGVSEGVPVNEKEKEGVTFKRIRLAQTRREQNFCKILEVEVVTWKF